MAIRSDGTVWTFGQNNFGQLGVNSTANLPTSLIPRAVPEISTAVQGAAGGQHSLVLRSDGKVWSFGYGLDGALGTGSLTTDHTPQMTVFLTGRIKQVACGTIHSIYLTETGQILTAGGNGFGQLGLGDLIGRSIPSIILGVFGITQISTTPTGYHNLALTSTGSVYSWGHNIFGQLGLGHTTPINTPSLIPDLANVQQVSTGTFHSLFLTKDANNITQVLGAGYNNNGELGAADFIHKTVPSVVYFSLSNTVDSVAGGYSWTQFISKGQLFVTGGNLGIEYLSPSQVFNLGPKSELKLVPGGLTASLIYLPSEGRAHCFGDNRNGQCAFSENLNVIVSRFSPSLVDSIANITEIGLGYGHMMLVHASGDVYAVGFNENYQLGTGDNLRQTLPRKLGIVPWVARGSKIVKVRSGFSHNIFLSNTSEIHTSGNGANGQNGLGGFTYTGALHLAGITSAIDVIAGGYHTHFLRKVGAGPVTLWSAGYNFFGQLGLGDTTDRNIFTQVTFAGTIAAISSGYFFTTILDSNGGVWAMGDNRQGQLGLGDFISRNVPIHVTLLSSLNVVQVASGSSHTIIRTNTSLAYTYGANDLGQLGQGDKMTRNTPTLISGLTNVEQVAALSHTMLIVSCPAGFSGPNCLTPVCFGISGLNPLVCQGQGVCSAPNTCTCYPPSLGTQCEINEYHWKGFNGDWSNPKMWYVKSRGTLQNSAIAPTFLEDRIFFDVPGNSTCEVNVANINVAFIDIGGSGSYPTLNIKNTIFNVKTFHTKFGTKLTFTSSSLNVAQNATFDGEVVLKGATFTGPITTFKSSLTTVTDPSSFTNAQVNMGGFMIVNAQLTITGTHFKISGQTRVNHVGRVSLVGSTVLNVAPQGVFITSGHLMSDESESLVSVLIDFSGRFIGSALNNTIVNIQPPIINNGVFELIGVGNFTLGTYTQNKNSRFHFFNTNLTMTQVLNITAGFFIAGGSMSVPQFNYYSLDGYLGFVSPLTIYGDAHFDVSSSIQMFLNGTLPDQIDFFRVTGSCKIDAFVIIKVANGFQPVTGTRYQFLDVGHVSSDTENVLLIGSPFKGAKYNFLDRKGYFEIVFSFGSVSNAGYRCHYLGNQRTIEMNYFSKQDRILLTLTTPIRANQQIGFGWSLEGDNFLRSIMTISRNNDIKQFHHDLGHVNPPVLDISASQSPSVFEIGPYYQTITITVPRSYLQNQTMIYYAETIANSSLSEPENHYHEKWNFPVFDEQGNVNSYQDCTNFLQPQRVEVYSLGVFISFLIFYVILFVAACTLSFWRPMNTRGISPHATIVFLFVQLLLEVKNYFEVPFFQGSLCVYYTFGVYPLQIVCFAMILLYFLRYFAVINLNEDKKHFYNQMKLGQSTMNKLQSVKTRLLKIVASTWFGVIGLLLAYVVVLAIFIIVLAGWGFVCQYSTLMTLKIINNLELIFLYAAIIGVLVYDIIPNFQLIIKFKWIQYIIYNDPYYFRVQILLFLPFMLFSLVAEIVNLFTSLNYGSVIQNHKGTMIVNTIIFGILLLIDCIFPMVMTVIEIIRSLFFKKTATNPIHIMLESPDIEAMFIEYCESEYSMENILCYKDCEQYKKSRDKNKASEIISKYLNGSASVFEINCTQKVLVKVRDAVAAGNFTEDLFSDVQKDCFVNMSETWFRFQASPLYLKYKKESKEKKEMIEGKL